MLQLFGVYSLVAGLVALARSATGVLFFNESIGLSAGSSIASAVVAIMIGAYLVTRPLPLASYLAQRRAA